MNARRNGWVDNREAGDLRRSRAHYNVIVIPNIQEKGHWCHYNDVIMGPIASQITSLTIVYSIVYSDVDQRKNQSSASLAFVREIHRTNGQLHGKCFHLMTSSWYLKCAGLNVSVASTSSIVRFTFRFKNTCNMRVGSSWYTLCSRLMHTDRNAACFGVLWDVDRFYSFATGKLHWHIGNYTISQVLVKEPKLIGKSIV